MVQVSYPQPTRKLLKKRDNSRVTSLDKEQPCRGEKRTSFSTSRVGAAVLDSPFATSGNGRVIYSTAPKPLSSGYEYLNDTSHSSVRAAPAIINTLAELLSSQKQEFTARPRFRCNFDRRITNTFPRKLKLKIVIFIFFPSIFPSEERGSP